MEEYKQLYELYQSKTDSELENIINSNEYTPIAIKVASDILKYGRIGYEEIIKQQGDTIALSESNSNKQNETLQKKRPAWLIAIAVICGIIACITIIFGISDLAHALNLNKQTNTSIEGNIYEGTGDFLGLVFYFYDKNTFSCSNTSGTKISYGIYEANGNAITLKFGAEAYYAVSLDNGYKIMINNSQLEKVTNSTSLKEYKNIFHDLD